MFKSVLKVRCCCCYYLVDYSKFVIAIMIMITGIIVRGYIHNELLASGALHSLENIYKCLLPESIDFNMDTYSLMHYLYRTECIINILYIYLYNPKNCNWKALGIDFIFLRFVCNVLLSFCECTILHIWKYYH